MRGFFRLKETSVDFRDHNIDGNGESSYQKHGVMHAKVYGLVRVFRARDRNVWRLVLTADPGREINIKRCNKIYIIPYISNDELININFQNILIL